MQFKDGTRAIVSGNANGISFKPGEVSIIFAHTHTTNAKASVADFEAMSILNQSQTTILHEGGIFKERNPEVKKESEFDPKIREETPVVIESPAAKWKQAKAKTDELLLPYGMKIKQMYPDAKIGYRGSLANGKTHAGGAFEISNFDVDAFIVSDQMNSMFDPESPWNDSRKVDGMEQICNEIEIILKNNFPGYTHPPHRPFTFRVFNKAGFVREVAPNGYTWIFK